MAAAPQVLQLCPNDLAPFADLCRVYAAAVTKLGGTCTTVFLDQRAASVVSPDSIDGTLHYLTRASEPVGGNSALSQRLLAHCADLNPTLTLCHRYRSYRVLRATKLRGRHNLVIAHEYNMLSRWQRKLERRWFGQAFTFAGIAPDVAQQLCDTTGESVVCPNAIDHEALNTRLLARATARMQLGQSRWQYSEPDLLIGVMGRLHPKKQPKLALDALAALTERAPTLTVQCAVIGDGELRREMQREATARNLPVHFCGFVPDAPTLLPALDLLLMTSTPAEAFGMVALEAMVAGTPVVAPQIPGPASVLGELGYYFPLRAELETTAHSAADAILTASSALAGTAELQQWQAQAMQRVKQAFSIDAVARELTRFWH